MNEWEKILLELREYALKHPVDQNDAPSPKIIDMDKAAEQNLPYVRLVFIDNLPYSVMFSVNHDKQAVFSINSIKVPYKPSDLIALKIQNILVGPMSTCDEIAMHATPQLREGNALYTVKLYARKFIAIIK